MTHSCRFIRRFIVSTVRTPSPRCLHSVSAGSDDSETVLTPLQEAVKEQGDLVQRLKGENRSKAELAAAVSELNTRKRALETRERLMTSEPVFDREGVQQLMKRRFFVVPSFLIYGGVSGLYDYGPLGCTMKSNLLSEWRSHFIKHEGMLEMECSTLTPEAVLKASGHAERFSDLMVKDLTTGQLYRADDLLEEHLQTLMDDPKCPPEKLKEYREVITKARSFSKEELTEKLSHYQATAPPTNNPISDPVEINLMFSTSIGASGQLPSYLRPETAQGIFVNFKHLLEENSNRLPFAVAQVGKAFRNEISVRSGVLRVREFEMAEIEHFVHPDKCDQFSKFPSVADLQLTLYTASDQLEGNSPKVLRLGDAVKQGVVSNETLGYYLGRIYLFLLRVGVRADHLRFRQHMPQEMAHYARDCWDAECRTSYGWVECVGCADRSCFDLERHAAATSTELCVKEPLPEPVSKLGGEDESCLVEGVKVVPEMRAIGQQFRSKSTALTEWLSELSDKEVLELEKRLKENSAAEVTVGDQLFTLEANMVNFQTYQKEINTVDIVPSVIEPSFGIGRILYSILEHNFQVREGDAQRVWLSLPPVIAPISCAILPVVRMRKFKPFIDNIVDQLTSADVSHKVSDGKGSVGRRYARSDEVGSPYAVTVDEDTVNMSTVSLRERNSMRQVRVKISELGGVVGGLVGGALDWEEVERQFPVFTKQETKQ